MKTEDVLKLLERIERRLAVIADQARETREQARHTLDRLNRLRSDVNRIRLTAIASSDTTDSLPVFEDKPREGMEGEQP